MSTATRPSSTGRGRSRSDVESFPLGWRRAIAGLSSRRLGRWCHVSGLDLNSVMGRAPGGCGRHLRCHRAVAYFPGNRRVIEADVPEPVRTGPTSKPIDDYPSHLLQTCTSSPPGTETPPKVVLASRPGVFNSAYFGTSFLAQRWASSLVEGRDLVCENNRVWMRSTRRPGAGGCDLSGASTTISLTPAVFPLPDSMLGGAAGCMEV